MPKKLRGPKKPPVKVNTMLILKCFYGFLVESQLNRVAGYLDTGTPQLLSWLKKHKELQEARAFAESLRKQQDTLKDYVYKRLSPDAKAVWDKISFWEGTEDEAGLDEIQKAMGRTPKAIRQELFLHALVRNSWNPSEACRVVGISYQTWEMWKIEPDFAMLYKQIMDMKKDFFESRIVDLCKAGDASAIIFVNRTLNRDRGYGEKLEVAHTGTVQHDHIDIESLELDLDTRRKVLEAMRRRAALQQAIPVEGVASPVETNLLPAKAA